MAERFIRSGEGRPLLDWLQERSPEVAAELERVRRLEVREAARPQAVAAGPASASWGSPR